MISSICSSKIEEKNVALGFILCKCRPFFLMTFKFTAGIRPHSARCVPPAGQREDESILNRDKRAKLPRDFVALTLKSCIEL